MPKESLKDKLEGNELDLSLNNLDSVPVKDLAAIPKATRLDLSCNQLTILPDNFSSLAHLVKIDLSKNRLTELPENFGNLQNLQHLDLLGNQLVLLPISFYRLTKLKWLDLKDNPLQIDLKKIAGDCLDENQCKKCATQVLKYLRDCNSELERMKQKKLKEEREAKQRLKAQEEAEKERVRQERKQKKMENKKKKEDSISKEDVPSTVKNKERENISNGNGKQATRPKKTDTKSGTSWFMYLAIVFAVFGITIGSFYALCQDRKNDVCEQYWKPTEAHATEFLFNAKTNTENLIRMSKETLSDYYDRYMGTETTAEEGESSEGKKTKTTENKEGTVKKEKVPT